jgi:hypothetical protein
MTGLPYPIIRRKRRSLYVVESVPDGPTVPLVSTKPEPVQPVTEKPAVEAAPTPKADDAESISQSESE